MFILDNFLFYYRNNTEYDQFSVEIPSIYHDLTAVYIQYYLSLILFLKSIPLGQYIITFFCI